MRIALANWSCSRAGGTEMYLSALIPALMEAGHDVALLAETDAPASRAPIIADSKVQSWSTQIMGRDPGLDALRRWKPDLVCAHGLRDSELESRVIDVAPSVLFAHSYYGTCISGNKRFAWPRPRPCSRQFGPACLLHYFPHRCGGKSPITMVRNYALQTRRATLLARYAGIVTHSAHMAREYERHGIDQRRIHCIPYGIAPLAGRAVSAIAPLGRPHLVFLGRMEGVKGGPYLLSALDAVQKNLARPIRVTMAGDGPDRRQWEILSSRVARANSAVEIAFPGWLDETRRDDLLRQAHLLVVPSTWPEPFGLVGVEAGRLGVPAAAFGVGGISEWLTDGVNGVIAPGEPPTIAGLSHAIVACLEDPIRYDSLRLGAIRLASRFTLAAHLENLIPVFRGIRARA